MGDGPRSILITSKANAEIRFECDGHIRRATYLRGGDVLDLDLDGRVHRFEDLTHRPVSRSSSGGNGVVRAPMSGLITAVKVVDGEMVTRGQLLAVLEAMKMEHQIVAPIDGTISQVAVTPGLQVGARDILIVLAPWA